MMHSAVQMNTSYPKATIVEQPSPEVRFRYSKEGPSHGVIQGENSGKKDKTFPSIQIKNYLGRVKVVAQLVTNDESENEVKRHPHCLVGKHCKDGICTSVCGPTISTNRTVQFPHLAIQRTTKKDAPCVLEQSLIERYLNQHSNQGAPSQQVKMEIKSRAEKEANAIDFNSVRLMFLVYACDNKGEQLSAVPIASVTSNPIFDSKSQAGTTSLKIRRICPDSSSFLGGNEISIICEKVHKDKVEVIFYTENQQGCRTWEATGKFSPCDVYHQNTICLRTPSYQQHPLANPTQVMVQLRRKSDNVVSDPRLFTYLPEIQASRMISTKRKTNDPHPSEESKRMKQIENGNSCLHHQSPLPNAESSDDLISRSPMLSSTRPTQERIFQSGPVDPRLLKILRVNTTKQQQRLSQAQKKQNCHVYHLPQSTGSFAQTSVVPLHSHNYNTEYVISSDVDSTTSSGEEKMTQVGQVCVDASSQTDSFICEVTNQSENERKQTFIGESSKVRAEKEAARRTRRPSQLKFLGNVSPHTLSPCEVPAVRARLVKAACKILLMLRVVRHFQMTQRPQEPIYSHNASNSFDVNDTASSPDAFEHPPSPRSYFNLGGLGTSGIHAEQQASFFDEDHWLFDEEFNF